MQKIYLVILLLFFGIACMAQDFSVVGCTYESPGLRHCVVSFISPSECVISQTDRLSHCMRVDTLLYHFDKKYMLLVEPSMKIDTPVCATTPHGNCWLNPYIYVDGVPLKQYPIAKRWIHEKFWYFVEQDIGRFFDMSRRNYLRILSPSLLLWRTRESGAHLRLKRGIPSIDADSIYSMMTDSEKESLAKIPSSSFGDCWFSRSAYASHRQVSLAGTSFEFSSTVKESWVFHDDSLCSYIQSVKKPYCRVEQYCHYSIGENGKVVIVADSISREGHGFSEYVDYSKKNDCHWKQHHSIEVENIITSDTLVLYGNFMLYSKVHASEDCYYTRAMPIHVMENRILLSKAYVRKGSLVPRSKIGRFYQKYLTPVNYNK